MAEIITIPDLENGKVDIDTLADIVNLQEPTTETRLSGPVKTWYGLLQDLAVTAGLGYETLAELQAITGTDGQMAEVTNDGGATGRYRWDGAAWVKSDNPTEQKVSELETDMESKVDKYTGERDGVLVSVTDASGRSTWIEANDTDGGPTDWSKKMVGNSLGIQFTAFPGVLFSVTDASGRLTDLTVDDVTGEFAQFVIDRLKVRLGNATPARAEIIYEQNQGGNEPITSGDFYNRDGEILPVLTDMTKLVGWGSSSMERSAAAYSALASSLGMTWFSGGIGGQATPQIAARAGSISSLVTFPGNSIPASGTNIAITISNVPGHASQDYTGFINGVHGRIYYPGGGARFDRITAGAAVPVEPDTPFISEAGQDNRAAVSLLWMGRNDLNGDVDRIDQCIENTDATFDWLAPLVKRTLVMGHFMGSLAPSEIVFDHIAQVNSAYRKRYGNLFVDVDAYLTSSQVWSDMGLTPTTADTNAQAVGTTPPQLLADSLHLTPAAYQAVATYCVRARMVALGWIQS